MDNVGFPYISFNTGIACETRGIGAEPTKPGPNKTDAKKLHNLCSEGLSRTRTKTTRRTFFRACVFTISLPHIWNGFIFYCGFYNVFLVPYIVLVSEMLSFTMVTKFNHFLIWKLHRFVLYEVVSKASRGSLLQQWFIRFLVFFQSNVFRKRVFFECSANAFADPQLFFRHCVAFTNLPKQSIA